MFTLDQLDSCFMSRAQAGHMLGLTAWQLNQLVLRQKLGTPRIAGVPHFYKADIERLVGSQALDQIRSLTDANAILRANKQEAMWGRT